MESEVGAVEGKNTADQIKAGTAKASKASQGLVRIDFAASDLKLVFGKWNARPLDEASVKELTSRMANQGIRRWDPSTFIQIGIDMSWIRKDSLAAKNSDFDDIPSWSSVVVDKTKKHILHPYSGQHRREAVLLLPDYIAEKKEAVLMHIQELDTQITELEAWRKKEEQKGSLGGEDSVQTTATLNGLKEQRTVALQEVGIWKGKEKIGTEWVAEVFDNGTLIFLEVLGVWILTRL